MESPSLTMTELRPEHNVARYCRPRTIVQGIISREAFLLRIGEQFLSTNWLEHFHEFDRMIQMSGVRATLAEKNFAVSPNGRFAVLNIGAAIRQIRDAPLRFMLLGQASDPSHAGIFGYTEAEPDIAGALALLDREEYLAVE